MSSCALFTDKELRYILVALNNYDPDRRVGDHIRYKIGEEIPQRQQMRKILKQRTQADTGAAKP